MSLIEVSEEIDASDHQPAHLPVTGINLYPEFDNRSKAP
jgi:hypothetical protein